MSHMNSLVVIEQQDEELADLRAEVEQLTARSERVAAEYAELDEAMRATVDTLEAEMPAYKSLFDVTMEELVALRQQHRVVMEEHDAREAAMRAARAEQEGYAGESDEDDEDDDEAGFAESMKARWRAQRERQQQQGGRGPAGRGSSRNPRHESLTKMFRRLANLCHPDKTADTYLQGLFAKGMEAREASDRAALADLLLSAELHANGERTNQDSETLKKRLREQKAQLEVRVRHTEMRVTGLSQTPLGKIHQLHTSTRDPAKIRSRSSFKKMLTERVTQMESEATAIREWLVMNKETPVA